ncbi:uncharacterized protein LOC130137512 isoform X2 [Syzygium oleosum]|uniref:uncharacterized protein LOC130137512 isoform X2 n=1 Tax=Syzygium oleosum TaxID=219896 RepID=UPI0024B9CB46|nr:uncharacterized protein LOC130137512 isoform X2 [Syzygium oleosum]
MVGWSVLILQIGQHMIYGNLRRKVELLLVAHEKFAERREVEKLVIAPNEKELGLAFNENQMMVTESLSVYARGSSVFALLLSMFGICSFTLCLHLSC